MTTAKAPDTKKLIRLYETYKQICSAYSAARLLGHDVQCLVPEAERLRTEARVAVETCDDPAVAEVLSYCVAAAEEICAVIQRDARGLVVDVSTDQLRASHRALRSQVWKFAECEYVPCSVKHCGP
ncbi:MAG: hypothetical protein K6T83_06985 [Alicyclobacillus sp.]|nr:hypothetical protein [Alicyclobacillus sp.]